MPSELISALAAAVTVLVGGVMYVNRILVNGLMNDIKSSLHQILEILNSRMPPQL